MGLPKLYPISTLPFISNVAHSVCLIPPQKGHSWGGQVGTTGFIRTGVCSIRHSGTEPEMQKQRRWTRLLPHLRLVKRGQCLLQ